MLLLLVVAVFATGLRVELGGNAKSLTATVDCGDLLVQPLAGSRVMGAVAKDGGEVMLMAQEDGTTRIVASGQALIVSFEVDARLWRESRGAEWLRCGEDAASFPVLSCRVVVERNATCFGEADGRVRVLVEGGVAPVMWAWQGAKNPEAARGGDTLQVRAWDALFRVCTADDVVMPPIVPLSGAIEVRPQSCSSDGQSFLNLSVTGGTPTYRFAWSGGGSTDEDVIARAGVYIVEIIDAAGCVARASAQVIRPDPLRIELKALEASAALAKISGGTAPYSVLWSSGERDVARITNMLPGLHWVAVTDAAGCRANATSPVMAVGEGGEINDCMDGRRDAERSLCFRKLGAPMLWAEEQRTCAGALAVVSVMREMQMETYKDAVDLGGQYLAVLLAGVVEKEPCCGVSIGNVILPFFVPHLRELYHTSANYSHFHQLAVAWIAFGKGHGVPWTGQSALVTVLTVGPFGFDNEPVFAPNLALPSRAASVVCLVLEAFVFPTSSLSLAVFPWSLQLDVNWAAMYVRDVARLIEADWIFPADSAGILSLSRLATHIYESDKDDALKRALERSMPWPPTYPPLHLSKLMPGHEPFAPRECVVSDSDGLHYQSPDVAAVEKAMAIVGPNAYAKREYSEASRGVAKDLSGSLSSALAAVAEVFPRASGVSTMDLELRVAIFMQQGVALIAGVLPVAVRFFARGGEMLAGHVSVAVESNIVYETIRHQLIEDATKELLKAVNYSGFGAAWWWRDNTQSEKPLLIDFNARLERQACLTPVLEARDLITCPCYSLQTGMIEEELFRSGAPHITRAGIRYMDPVRAMDSGRHRVLRLLRDESTPWNVQRGDIVLHSLIRRQASLAVARAAEEARRDA